MQDTPANAKSLTVELNGSWHGSYGRALCPVCGGNPANPPLSISDGTSRLLLTCFRGCDYFTINAALGASFRPTHRDPEAARRARVKAEEQQKKRELQARQVWWEAKPAGGSLVEQYLKHRSITCEIPKTIKFHSHCWHGPTARTYPAMVALIEGGAGFAVHRTYLTDEGTKAPLEPSKMMLGAVSGGAVRLSEGKGPLLVAEGIETALAASGLHNGAGHVWAALSTSGIKSLDLPPEGGELWIAVDGDPAGRAAGRELAERANRSGWAVWIYDPGDGLDFADLSGGVNNG